MWGEEGTKHRHITSKDDDCVAEIEQLGAFYCSENPLPVRVTKKVY
jgi:hypothetical protein